MVKMKKYTISIFLFLFSVSAFSQKTAIEYYEDAQEKIDLKDYMGALEDLNKAIALKPDYAQAYVIRGIVKNNLEDYSGSIKDLNKAIELKPDNAEAYYLRAVLKSCLKEKDYIGVIQDASKAIELKPDYVAAYYRRGINKFYIEDYRGAIQDFNKAIELKSSYAHAYYMRGLSKIFLEDININDGCLDLRRAFELGYIKANYAIEKYCDQNYGNIEKDNKPIKADLESILNI